MSKEIRLDIGNRATVIYANAKPTHSLAELPSRSFETVRDALEFCCTVLIPYGDPVPCAIEWDSVVVFAADELMEARRAYGGYGKQNWEWWLAETARYDNF